MFYEPDILEIVIRQMPGPGAGAGDGSSLQISAFYILCYGNVSGEHSQRSSTLLGWAGVGVLITAIHVNMSQVKHRHSSLQAETSHLLFIIIVGIFGQLEDGIFKL